MKKIYLLITSITMAFILNACGDSDRTPTTQIDIVDCNTTNYTDVLSGDTIVPDEDNTTIQTVLNTDGSEKVCVSTGAAHIER